jgi:cysteine synthase
MYTGSRRFQLDSVDINKWLKGASIAAAGAVLGYVSTAVLPELEGMESEVGAVAAAIGAIVVNLLRKWLADNS